MLSGFFGSVGLYPHYDITPRMQTRADELLKLLEVEHLASKAMTEMSTGEARRMLIARALVHSPKALILDEPSDGLDPHAARKFGDSLRKIARAGKSVILVTHHLPDIIPEISRVIMLQAGRLFADGPKHRGAHLRESLRAFRDARGSDGARWLLSPDGVGKEH